jgi:dihydrofolate synthase/folylpolyglutamate synthase
MVSEEYVTGFVDKLKPLIEEIEPSFFEITVAMAFQYFMEQEIDIAIIEVGLGGRLDSTNIILPELSIITNIGWDHMNMLGNSLEVIAGEKAGIIKENVPVVIGETVAETKPVFQQIAAERKAKVYWAEECFLPKKHQLHANSLLAEFRKQNGSLVFIESDLAGIYQLQNIRTVLTAVDVLKKSNWKLDENTIKAALETVKSRTGLGGRWEVIHQKPMIVLEVAHNENGIEKMMEHIQQITYGQLHLIIGMVKDKEVEKVLKLLPADAGFYFTQAAIARALPAAELKEKAEALNLTGGVYDNVNQALNAAKSKAQGEDLIIVCGSIFLVAEVDKSQYVISPNRSRA